MSLAAGQTLQALGPAARGALPAVVEALRTTNDFIGNMASAVIVSVARDASEAVPLLTSMLLERDEVKIRVLQIFPRLGKTAASAERAVEALVTSTNESLRFAALAALWDIFPTRHLELFPKLEEFARSPDKNRREFVGQRLVRMEPLTERAAELLTVTIREGSDDFCWSAFVILSKRGREASNAVPALIAGLDAANPRVAAKAAAALGAFATADQGTLGALEKAMQHESLMVRDAASEAIERIGAKPD